MDVWYVRLWIVQTLLKASTLEKPDRESTHKQK